MNLNIREPASIKEWSDYYQLRWQILRAPWHQPVGSEKDELEDKAIHRAAFLENDIIAIGRLHLVDELTAQIRYMAVKDNWRQKGIGQQVLRALELSARERNVETILLNARENAVGFYLKNNYREDGPAKTLFDTIKHIRMKKHPI